MSYDKMISDCYESVNKIQERIDSLCKPGIPWDGKRLETLINCRDNAQTQLDALLRLRGGK